MTLLYMYFSSLSVNILSCLFVLVKFLVFPSEFGESPPLCDVEGSCNVPSQRPFLSKNPVNQTGNITVGKEGKKITQ